MIRYKEFGFVQDRKLLLTLVPFYYHWDFGRMLLSDKSDIFYSLLEGAALLEGLLRRHGAGGEAEAVRRRVPAAAGGGGGSRSSSTVATATSLVSPAPLANQMVLKNLFIDVVFKLCL